MKRDRGIALFQVLAMSTIISLLIILAMRSSQQNISQATKLEQHTRKQHAIRSAFKFLQYQLLTKDWLGEGTGESDIGWNFYGKDFTLTLPQSPEFAEIDYQISVSIQDQEGLIDIHTSPATLRLLLGKVAPHSTDQHEAMVNSLMRSQQLYSEQEGLQAQTKPMMQLQHLSELNFIDNWDETSVKAVSPYVTIYGSKLNIAMAPDFLLPLLLTQVQAQTIKQWRLENAFNLDSFSSLTGIYGDELFSLYPGQYLFITMTDNTSGIRAGAMLKLATYDIEAVQQFEFYLPYAHTFGKNE